MNHLALPALAAASLVAGIICGSVWVCLLALGLLACVMPIATQASTRLTLWLVAGLAIGALLSYVPFGSHPKLSGVAIAVVAVTVGSVIASSHPDVGWRPEVDVGDALVVVGSAVLLLEILWPFRGAGVEGVLLDLSRGFDQLNHFAMFNDILNGGVNAWGSYPRGFHSLLALVFGASNPARVGVVPERIMGFAILSGMVTAAAAAVVGWVAVDLAGSLGREESRRVRRRMAGVSFLLFAPLGGLFSGLFELGHVAFLLPVAVVVGASWQAARPTERSRLRSLVVLAVAGFGVVGSYPPLAVGLMPAVVLVLLAWVRGRSALARLPDFGVVALASVLPVALLLFAWRRSLAFVVAATGEASTRYLTVLIALALALLLALIASWNGYPPPPVAAWGPSLGFGIAAAGLGLLAVLNGYAPFTRYYVVKLLQASWIGLVPLILALGATLLASAAPTWGKRGRVVVLGSGAVLVGMSLAMMPDGRYLFSSGAFPGPRMMERRMLEAKMASREDLSVVAVARELGSYRENAGVLIEQSGWQLPVIRDGSERFMSTATHAMNALRGGMSLAEPNVSHCLDTKEGGSHGTAQCIEDWLSDAEPRTLTLVFQNASSVRDYRPLSARFPGRAQLLLLNGEGESIWVP